MEEPFFVKSHNVNLDSEYVDWLSDLKSRYRKAQARTAIQVNSEQLMFNWQLGRDLIARKAEEKWGAGIVEQVSQDLQNAFPGEKGFSTRNLFEMKRWYLFYTADLPKLKKSVSLLQISDKQIDKKVQQAVALLPNMNDNYDFVENIPLPFILIPWSHHIMIVRKCKSIEEAFFYINKVIEFSWSRETLRENIKDDLFKKQHTVLNNFDEHLPPMQSELAKQILKDPYNFDFISLPSNYDERQLEKALEENITRFLLELGTGFAFVGRQKEIVVAGRSRRIDMLFYHYRLRCYVVCELKVKDFEPEFAGKLNYYVNAVDQLLKTDEDNPTIGLLICRYANETDVQWSFKGIETPLGVASYEKVQKMLPSVEELKKQIELIEQQFRQHKQ